MQLHHDGRVATLSLTLQDLHRGDPEATVNYGLLVRGVEVAVLFKEDSTDHYRISLRSREDVDVSAVAHIFGGGGHSLAAGCEQEGNLEEVRSRILAAIQQVLP